MEHGDLIVNLFTAGPGGQLEHLREDGVPVSTTVVGGGYPEGAVVTASGRLATTTRGPHRVRMYAGGAEVAFFELPQFASIPGDLDRFSDGTLVVVDQGGKVEAYLEDGSHVATFTAPQMTHPFGCHVDAQDHLWVGDIVDPSTPSGYLFEFARDGTLLQAIVLAFEPGDVAVAPDGTVWTIDRPGGIVHHLDASGAPLASFDGHTNGTSSTLALQVDGTLLTAGAGDDRLLRVDPQGALLGDIPLPSVGQPLFVYRVGQLGVGTSYCFGAGGPVPCPCANTGGEQSGCANSAGAGAQLSAVGSESVADDSLRFVGSGLVPSQPALLFAGTTAVNGGAGVAFGDGLRCAGGAVTRLGVQTASASGSASWGPGLVAVGGWQAGDVRRFQGWYRDPLGGPCGTGLNLSNGVELVFAP